MKFVVLHSYYGCDTGCCGHTVDVNLEPGEKYPGSKSRRGFEFIHPYGEDHLKFAQDLVRDQYGEEHVKDLDWENCTVSED